MDYWTIMKEQELNEAIPSDQMRLAIDHLSNAVGLMMDVMEAFDSGVFNMLLLSRMCEESWNEMNKCRIYTERILFIEEVVIPAMGQMYDAKCMFDSLVAWKLGMTSHAALSIRGCIQGAEAAVRQCIDEMVSWLDPVDGNSEEDTFNNGLPDIMFPGEIPLPESTQHGGE